MTRRFWRSLFAASLLAVSLPILGQSLQEAKAAAKGAIKAFFHNSKRIVEKTAAQSPRIVATLADKRIGESSGLAASWRNPGVLWTHNDSGDGPYLFAINLQGKTLARFKVTGAKAVDWEDIAVGPGANGSPALYIADTGDNGRSRESPTLYRVEEPAVLAGTTMQERQTAPCEEFRLDFPKGARDCETLLVHPKTGEVCLVTKEGDGKSEVYALPMPLRPNKKKHLDKVGKIHFKSSIFQGRGKYADGERMATGGAVSRDGTRLIVRTYLLGYQWRIAPGESLAKALEGEPSSFLLPLAKQGESVTYSAGGKSLFLTSEQQPCPLYQIPLP